MAKRVTIQDLANDLNTTPSTISRALRGHPGISKSMKEKVVSHAKSRNYIVNSLAANLRNGKSRTIGVIIPRVNRDFFSNVISGIEEVANENGYTVVISQTHDNYEKEKECIKTLLNSRVDGIIVSVGLETVDYSHFDKVLAIKIPLIFFDRVYEGANSINIVNNDKEGAVKAVNHLVEMGYKRIAHIAGPENINVYRDRKHGYLSALENNKLEVDTGLIITNTLKTEDGIEAAKLLMSLPNPPDAIFSASDYAALGAMTWLLEQGYDIPNDIGIVGYSNEKFTAYLRPALTSIDQHGLKIGKYSAKLFFEEVNSKDEDIVPRSIKINPKLLIRSSSRRKTIEKDGNIRNFHLNNKI